MLIVNKLKNLKPSFLLAVISDNQSVIKLNLYNCTSFLSTF